MKQSTLRSGHELNTFEAANKQLAQKRAKKHGYAGGMAYGRYNDIPEDVRKSGDYGWTDVSALPYNEYAFIDDNGRVVPTYGGRQLYTSDRAAYDRQVKLLQDDYNNGVEYEKLLYVPKDKAAEQGINVWNTVPAYLQARAEEYNDDLQSYYDQSNLAYDRARGANAYEGLASDDSKVFPYLKVANPIAKGIYEFGAPLTSAVSDPEILEQTSTPELFARGAGDAILDFGAMTNRIAGKGAMWAGKKLAPVVQKVTPKAAGAITGGIAKATAPAANFIKKGVSKLEPAVGKLKGLMDTVTQPIMGFIGGIPLVGKAAAGGLAGGVKGIAPAAAYSLGVPMADTMIKPFSGSGVGAYADPQDNPGFTRSLIAGGLGGLGVGGLLGTIGGISAARLANKIDPMGISTNLRKDAADMYRVAKQSKNAQKYAWLSAEDGKQAAAARGVVRDKFMSDAYTPFVKEFPGAGYQVIPMKSPRANIGGYEVELLPKVHDPAVEVPFKPDGAKKASGQFYADAEGNPKYYRKGATKEFANQVPDEMPGEYGWVKDNELVVPFRQHLQSAVEGHPDARRFYDGLADDGDLFIGEKSMARKKAKNKTISDPATREYNAKLYKEHTKLVNKDGNKITDATPEMKASHKKADNEYVRRGGFNGATVRDFWSTGYSPFMYGAANEFKSVAVPAGTVGGHVADNYFFNSGLED